MQVLFRLTHIRALLHQFRGKAQREFLGKLQTRKFKLSCSSAYQEAAPAPSYRRGGANNQRIQSPGLPLTDGELLRRAGDGSSQSVGNYCQDQLCKLLRQELAVDTAWELAPVDINDHQAVRIASLRTPSAMH